VAINVTNIIIKMLLIVIISKIGEDTKSAMMNSIKIGIFVTQYFNTAILITLASANFTESKIPLLGMLF